MRKSEKIVLLCGKREKTNIKVLLYGGSVGLVPQIRKI